MNEVTLVVSILSFVVGCFVGSTHKENQLSYRLNVLRSHVDVLRGRVELLEVEK